MFCGCGHEIEAHHNPHFNDQLDAAESTYASALEQTGDIDRATDAMFDSAWLMSRPCAVLDCNCNQFVMAPLPVGTYLATNVSEDGYEIVKHEFTGLRRLCFDCRRPILEDHERYTVIVFAHQKYDEVEFREAIGTLGEVDLAEEDRDDMRIHTEAPVRGIPLAMCVTCCTGTAANGPLPDDDLDDDNLLDDESSD